MSLSIRQRREAAAREFLYIEVLPMSDGQWCSTVVGTGGKDDVELFRSRPQPTPAEALPFAADALAQRVERIVDGIEREARRDELANMTHADREAELLADSGW